MVRHTITIAGAALALCATSPATAQDYTGNVDPSEWSRPTVMDTTLDAQVRGTTGRSSARTGNGLSAEAYATCANKHKLKGRYGSRNGQVTQLYRLCARAGM